MRKSLTRFPKEEILRRKKDIDRVFRSGRRLSVQGVKLYCLENGLDYSRFFVTLVRKFGNSVERNRARRVLKEAYRLKKQNLPPGWDFVFVLFPSPGGFDFFEQDRNLDRLFKKAGFFPGKKGPAGLPEINHTHGG